MNSSEWHKLSSDALRGIGCLNGKPIVCYGDSFQAPCDAPATWSEYRYHYGSISFFYYCDACARRHYQRQERELPLQQVDDEAVGP
jgi:hypothetical protein